MRSEQRKAVLSVMKPGDWILISGAVLLSIITAVMVWLPGREAAGVARVYADTQLVCSLPLDTDTTYTLDNGESQNVIEVKNGEVHMLSATCRDEYCVRQGYIHYNGETLICLPNRVVVELESEEESGLDAIAS